MRDILFAWRRNRRAAGQRLRSLREQADLTQAALAARTGVSSNTISRVEAGLRLPQAGTIKRLAQGLGVPPDALVTGLDPPSPFAPHSGSAIEPPGRHRGRSLVPERRVIGVGDPPLHDSSPHRHYPRITAVLGRHAPWFGILVLVVA